MCRCAELVAHLLMLILIRIVDFLLPRVPNGFIIRMDALQYSKGNEIDENDDRDLC